MLADLVADAPRRLIGHAELALQFLRRDAVPRHREQVHGIEPELQRRPGLLERRSNRRVQVVPATAARIGALCLDAIPARGKPALGARVVRPEARGEQVREAGFVVGELPKEFAGGEWLRHATYIAKSLPVCQGDKHPNHRGSRAFSSAGPA